MSWNEPPILRAGAIAAFDVICAGEARWDLSGPPALSADTAVSWRDVTASIPRVRPAGAAVMVALSLARRGLRVGLSASLGDDTVGRGLLERISAAGVDTAGVSLSAARSGLFLVQGMGAAAQVVSYRREEAPIVVPEGWSGQVLLLTGVSPVVGLAASFCKEARAARRTGTVVMIDINARRHVWMGHDPRVLGMVLREADVVRASSGDLATLGLEAGAVRAMARKGSVVVLSGATRVQVTGPFGEVAAEIPASGAAIAPSAAIGAGDAFTASACAALARTGPVGLERADVWHRLLPRAQGASLLGGARL
ncbi:MAG: carbohydrate kinase family protein [Polyangiaceae bacterium]